MKVKKNLSHKLRGRILNIIMIGVVIPAALPLFSATALAQSKTGKSASDKQTKPDTTKVQSLDEAYVIGNNDKISITFWQQQDLNREVRVDEQGMITLPVIGEVKAAGLTTSELARKIVQQMSFYNTPVSQATVIVTEFNSRSVVVAGQVHTPGTYRYEVIPDIWKVILDAGGPLAEADLTRVSVVRKEGEKSNVIDVDLYNIIKSGDMSRAPKLFPGDLVNVPTSTFGTPMTLGGETGSQGKNVFFIFGEVTEQGPRNLESGMDVLDAIVVAKGVTAGADLKNVRVICKNKGSANVVKLDLDKYTKTGNPPRFLLHPEDTIIVPARRSSGFSSVLGVLGTVAPLLSATGTLILLVRR